MSNEYSSLDTVKYSYDTGVGKTASQLSDESNFIVQQLMDGLMLPWLLPFHSLTSYWSLQDKDTYNFYVDQNIGLHFVHYFSGFGNDPYLNTLVGTRYQVSSNIAPIFGFRKVETPEGVLALYMKINVHCH